MIPESDHPVRHWHINAQFILDSTMGTTADGVNASPGNGRNDEVDALARVRLMLAGTGFPTAPYLARGVDTFGFYEEGVQSATINPHTRENPPKVIPITIDFAGGSGEVGWIMHVNAQASVRSQDFLNNAVGSAIAIGDFSHSLLWGGITSVRDGDTGELITNTR